MYSYDTTDYSFTELPIEVGLEQMAESSGEVSTNNFNIKVVNLPEQ